MIRLGFSGRRLEEPASVSAAAGMDDVLPDPAKTVSRCLALELNGAVFY
jgi:hypothetical protein